MRRLCKFCTLREYLWWLQRTPRLALSCQVSVCSAAGFFGCIAMKSILPDRLNEYLFQLPVGGTAIALPSPMEQFLMLQTAWSAGQIPPNQLLTFASMTPKPVSTVHSAPGSFLFAPHTGGFHPNKFDIGRSRSKDRGRISRYGGERSTGYFRVETALPEGEGRCLERRGEIS